MAGLREGTRRTIEVDGAACDLYSLPALYGGDGTALARLPFSMRVLLENLLRNVDGETVTEADVLALADWPAARGTVEAVAFRPARVLMQDFSGIPGLVDMAAMRDAAAGLGADPKRINPVIPVDLIVDHSLTVDRAGDPGAMAANVATEFARNRERYAFVRWAQQAFANLRVAPPGGGILHQVNVEHLARVVWVEAKDGRRLAYPDTLVGTDSHTTMVNALGVLGWGVGGIEAEAAMLGAPLVFRLPRVVGVRLTGRLREGVTATDLVLTLTERLRKVGVVEAFVEFTGPALDATGAGALGLADRATLANMAPDYGATMGFFPVDRTTIDYLRLTGRDPAHVALVEAYSRAQGLWREAGQPEPVFDDVVELDLGAVEPSAAGPRRPQDRVALSAIPAAFDRFLGRPAAGWEGGAFGDGAVVLAAITSCTNTSNPHVMVAAGLLARNAVARGLKPQPWVKTSLTPGSRVVGAYLEKSGLQRDLDALGFHVAGYGCATCAGNSGDLAPPVEARIRGRDLVACAVLSGNRNFEGRIHPLARASWLMSPPLVVAYALAGRIAFDPARDPLGTGSDGRPVFLADIWPSSAEIEGTLAGLLGPDLFRQSYAGLFEAGPEWRAIPSGGDDRFAWNAGSTYIVQPPYFDDMPAPGSVPADVAGARVLLVLGDSVTTDHISPVSNIAADSPAGTFLAERQVPRSAFNSYGARRANHDVMVRGTFANIRLRNEMAGGREGGFTRHQPSGELMTVHAAAERYAAEGVPLVVVAGAEYGTGSSRDWAAKGARLLGVKAVIAESFERIHRANLVAMGVLPLTLPAGTTRRTLGIDGTERVDLPDLARRVAAGEPIEARIHRADGGVETVPLGCRLDNASDVRIWAAGGILPHVLRTLTEGAA